MELPLRASAAFALVALTAAGLAACSGGGEFELGGDGDAAPDVHAPDGHVPDAPDGVAPDASDANAHDAADTPDGAGRDAGHEAGGGGEGDAATDAPDAGTDGDLGSDSSSPDARSGDAHTPDADAADAGVHDAETPDANGSDASPPDADLPDGDRTDGDRTDGDRTDGDLPDGDLPDANLPDANRPDASGVCSPGASRCVPQGSEFCTDHGTWNLQVGSCASGCVAASGRYVVSADTLTVEDTSTGLVWQRVEPPASKDSAAAAAYCASLPALGGQGRLPTRAELEALLIKGTCVPSIDQAAFPSTSTTATWTSENASTGNTWVVEFATGTTVMRPSSASGATRCVR